MSSYSFVRADHSSIHKDFVLELNILSGDSESVNSHPLADSVLPSDNATFDEGVALNLGSFHDGAVVDLDTRTNHTVGTNDNIGSK